MYRLRSVAVLVETLVERGELAEADEILGPLSFEAEGDTIIAANLCLSRSRLRLAQRRHDAGLADALRAGAIATRTGLIAPSVLPWRSQAALALAALGDREGAERRAGEEVLLARAFGAPRTLGVALRAAALATGGGAEAEGLLREAVSALAAAGARLEEARAEVDLGAMLRRDNRRAEARSLLGRGLDTADRLDAPPLARYAETELRATGARPRRVRLTGAEALTASERRVAELAAEGLTNRQIAQALFITARTVEGHLTHVFQKLSVRSRDDLAGALGPAPGQPAAVGGGRA
jgi:DNA-binding CsgD family transcriptional regulator